MTKYFFIAISIILIQCRDRNYYINQESNKEQELLKGEISYDSLSKTPVDNAYKPNYSIEFNHSIHAGGTIRLACDECHSTGKEAFKPVGFNSCAKCHDVSIDYSNYVIEDKKSYIKKMNELNSLIKKEKH